MKNVKYDQFRAKDDLRNLTPVIQSFATNYTTNIKHASGIKGEFKAVAKQLLKKRKQLLKNRKSPKTQKIVYSSYKDPYQLEKTIQVMVGTKTASDFEV